MKILHIITDLNKGGAETSLYNFIKYSDKTNEHAVISLNGEGYFSEKIKGLCNNVIHVAFRKHPIKSWRIIKKESKNFDIICCWMYHANLIGLFLKQKHKTSKVVWNIRHTYIKGKIDKKATDFIIKYCSKKSDSVDMIVYNGENSKRSHELIGYKNEKSYVIGNGCDLNIFTGQNYNYLRNLLNISDNKHIILSVGRNHPAKDPATFLQALGELKRNNYPFVGVMCGAGYTYSNSNVICLCENNNLEIKEDVFLLGQQENIASIMSSCDFFVLHSASEAFPNVLLQAMASKCICISTNVGDVKNILDDCYIVPVGDYRKISLIIEELSKLNSKESIEIKEKNRKIVVSNYDIKKVVNEYGNMLMELF
jgi:glycosyltransferase involved in cell wall biosynthesis